MSDDIAIRVEHLSKCYHLYDTPRDRLRQFVLPRAQRLVGAPPKQYYREFWALKDVSFEVRKGETVGIIGRNGSGKSTLLQMICGTLNPSGGSVTTHGRIAALLELGSGFNPEFTGRENVYMNCALLGLGKEETDARFDDIAAFADIGEFIDQPVKAFSSGMFVRLAFAVNVVSSPDIMIVDEALAVGDMSFQAKCMTALTRFQEHGGTVLFVSHDVGTVKSLCQQAVYLERGQVICAGPAPEVAERYVRTMREELSQEVRKFARVSGGFAQGQAQALSSTEASKDAQAVDGLPGGAAMRRQIFKRPEEFDRRVAAMRYGSGGARITYVELLDRSGEPVVAVDFNQRVNVRIHFEVRQETELSVNYYIQDDKKNLIAGAGLRTIGSPFIRCYAGSRHVATYVTSLPLQEGNYSIQVQLTKPVVPDETAEFLDVIDNAVVFNMARRPVGRVWTKVYLENAFEILTL
ncbi:MAG: ABC transporter ATP-binding protein [Pseudomonadota bacterium]